MKARVLKVNEHGFLFIEKEEIMPNVAPIISHSIVIIFIRYNKCALMKTITRDYERFLFEEEYS